MKHLSEIVTELESKGVGFQSITENIDTTTSGGRLVFHLFGALAQFERDLIRERTRAGLQAAEKRGRRGGRQAVVTPERLVKARQHLAAGLNVREAAARVKIGKTALYEALKPSTPPDPGEVTGLHTCSRQSCSDILSHRPCRIIRPVNRGNNTPAVAAILGPRPGTMVPPDRRRRIAVATASGLVREPRPEPGGA
jgi:hypothetical protein